MAIRNFLKSSSHDKKRAFLVLGGVVVILLVFFFTASNVDSLNPVSCVKCHVIEPYYYTWQNSPHAAISCDKCHVEPGQSIVTTKLQRAKEWFVYKTGDVQLPIQGSRDISSETCLQCHSKNRVITPNSDVRSDFHAEHLGYGTSCVDCHYEVAHTGMRKKKPFEYSEKAMEAFKNVEYSDFGLTKTSCLECHDGKRVTYSCDACHENTSIPESHDLASFPNKHGAYVREDVGECIRCHTGFGKARDPQGETLPEITRNAKFCVECHEGNRPASHNSRWSVWHKLPGKTNFDGCLVCHDWETPQDTADASSIVTCATCHDATPGGHDNKRWFYDHKITVEQEGSVGCFSCHGANSCLDCHTKEQVSLKF